MAEIQNELNLQIGNKEAVTLKPSVVEIVNITILELGEKKARKVVCEVKHPDNQDPIKISAVKYEVKGKLDTSGLWVNLDADKLIRKGCALAVFLNYVGAKTPQELKGMKLQTTSDDKGYLVFKAY